MAVLPCLAAVEDVSDLYSDTVPLQLAVHCVPLIALLCSFMTPSPSAHATLLGTAWGSVSFILLHKWSMQRAMKLSAEALV